MNALVSASATCRPRLAGDRRARGASADHSRPTGAPSSRGRRPARSASVAARPAPAGWLGGPVPGPAHRRRPACAPRSAVSARPRRCARPGCRGSAAGSAARRRRAATATSASKAARLGRRSARIWRSSSVIESRQAAVRRPLDRAGRGVALEDPRVVERHQVGPLAVQHLGQDRAAHAPAGVGRLVEHRRTGRRRASTRVVVGVLQRDRRQVARCRRAAAAARAAAGSGPRSTSAPIRAGASRSPSTSAAAPLVTSRSYAG